MGPRGSILGDLLQWKTTSLKAPNTSRLHGAGRLFATNSLRLGAEGPSRQCHSVLTSMALPVVFKAFRPESSARAGAGQQGSTGGRSASCFALMASPLLVPLVVQWLPPRKSGGLPLFHPLDRRTSLPTQAAISKPSLRQCIPCTRIWVQV